MPTKTKTKTTRRRAPVIKPLAGKAWEVHERGGRGRRMFQAPAGKGELLSEGFREEELLRRALAGYFRAGNTAQPSDGASSAEVVDGLLYVVLRNVRGVLACYRVRHDGKLKLLKRPPAELGA